MFTRRRLGSLLVTSCAILALFLFVRTTSPSWQHIPQAIGLRAGQPTPKEIASGKNILPDLREAQPVPSEDNNRQIFFPGTLKPIGSVYSRTLVMPRTKEENVSWVDEELGDLVAPKGPLSTAIYVVDDPEAPLHPPKNKGHEVMVYLSYIIDHYEDLPDVAIFMHSHRLAWHNNELFERDAAAMIRYLSPERVTRQGYFNLRCHWDPGCPDWIHPGATSRNYKKEEEPLIAQYWPQIYPLDPVPSILSQPCCAQFALSRERIRAIPLARYNYLRDWLLNTALIDYYSGRMFEYTWQFLFTGHSIECPAMHVCYCDGYGMCFGGASEFNEWFEMRYTHNEYEEELREIRAKQELIADAQEDGGIDEAAVLDVPELGREEWLVAKIDVLKARLKTEQDAAFIRGASPQARAEEVGRPWKEGDGF